MMLTLPPAIVAGELVRLQTRQHVVALTFDGGGNADGAKGVLAVLRREKVPGTFFLTGHFVESYPLLARVIGRRWGFWRFMNFPWRSERGQTPPRCLSLCH